MTRYPPRPAWTKLLVETADALYGEQNIHRLARELDYNPRTVQRWLTGQNTVPPFIWPPLIKLIEARREHLDKLKLEITETLNATEGTET
jgi:hypothetical protein